MGRIIFSLGIFFIGISSWGQNFADSNIVRYNQLFYGYKTKHFKLTIKSGLNNSINTNDILSSSRQDLRLKVYLGSNISLVNRVLVLGLDSDRFIYSSGLVIRF